MEDTCWSCKSENINLTGEVDIEGEYDQIGKLYTCEDCDAEGTMWYDVELKFSENFGE